MAGNEFSLPFLVCKLQNDYFCTRRGCLPSRQNNSFHSNEQGKRKKLPYGVFY